MQPIETVKVVSEVTPENPLGYVVINRHDMTEKHVVFTEDQPKKSKAKADKEAE